MCAFTRKNVVFLVACLPGKVVIDTMQSLVMHKRQSMKNRERSKKHCSCVQIREEHFSSKKPVHRA